MPEKRCVTCGADEDRCLELTLADEDDAPGACCGSCLHEPGRERTPWWRGWGQPALFIGLPSLAWFITGLNIGRAL